MIVVCSLDDLVSVCSSIKPKYLISVIDPGYEPETPKDVKYHLKLGFDDIVKISSENKIFSIDETYAFMRNITPHKTKHNFYYHNLQSMPDVALF